MLDNNSSLSISTLTTVINIQFKGVANVHTSLTAKFLQIIGKILTTHIEVVTYLLKRYI